MLGAIIERHRERCKIEKKKRCELVLYMGERNEDEGYGTSALNIGL